MKLNRTRRIWPVALMGVAMLGASPVLGGTVPAQSPDEIVRGLEGRGYTAIRDVEFDDGVWELEATSPAGKPVDLVVEPGSGKILHEEIDLPD